MQQRQLGKGGPMVGAMGLGAMSLAGAFGPTDEETGYRARRVQRQRLQHGKNILFDGELAENRGVLRQIADAPSCSLVHRKVGELGAVQRDAPAVGRGEPDDHVEGG